MLLGIWLTRKQASHQFRNCYDKTWGGFKDRTQPALGNHEYGDRTAIGYYSYDLGDRHIVVLNTNYEVKTMGGSDRGSPQEAWLRSDLRHPNACDLAYGHHALFSSGVSNSHALHPRLRPYSPVASKATVP